MLGLRRSRATHLAGGSWLAFSAVFVGVVNDILVAHHIWESIILPYTFMAFILMQSAILSGRSAQAFRQVEHLSKNLQEEVEVQTKDLIAKTREQII